MVEKKVKIRGVEYTLKKIPPREWARLRDRCRDPKSRYGHLIEEKYLSEIFEHLVVNPRVSLDDFEDWDVCQEVANAAVDFQLGAGIAE